MFKTYESTFKQIVTQLQNQFQFSEDLQRQVTELQNQTKQNTNEIDRLKSELKKAKTEIHLLKRQTNNLTHDLAQDKARTNKLETDTDKLESYSRRNNVIFHGIPEDHNAPGREDCATKVHNLVQQYIPDGEWQTDSIDMAHRLGVPREGRPRPMLVRFLRWPEVLKVMNNKTGRENLRRQGILTVADHTTRQRQELKNLKLKGLRGHVYKGKVVCEDNQPITQTSTSQQQPPDNRYLNPTAQTFTPLQPNNPPRLTTGQAP